MCLVSSSLRLNLRSHSCTGQAYGRSCTGVLLGRFGYFRARTGTSRIGRLDCWYTCDRISCPFEVAWLNSASVAGLTAVPEPEPEADWLEDMGAGTGAWQSTKLSCLVTTWG